MIRNPHYSELSLHLERLGEPAAPAIISALGGFRPIPGDGTDPTYRFNWNIHHSALLAAEGRRTAETSTSRPLLVDKLECRFWPCDSAQPDAKRQKELSAIFKHLKHLAGFRWVMRHCVNAPG